MTLNEIMKNTADAIREKKGTTELIAPVDFANEIKGISGGSGGGELEGEYFLAKPNGRYWKSKLANIIRGKYPGIEISHDISEQVEGLYFYCSFISYLGFSGVGDCWGMPFHSTDICYFGPELYARAKEDIMKVQGIDVPDTAGSLLGAWQEGSLSTQNSEGGGIVNGVVDLIKILMENDEMSDDEALAMVSEMCMMEQITKEEYESYYNW
jgi:hypothetical protein